MTPQEFFEFAKAHGAEMMDLKFCDMLGTWQHCSYPVETLDEGAFEEGLGFDGSSHWVKPFGPLPEPGALALLALGAIALIRRRR